MKPRYTKKRKPKSDLAKAKEKAWKLCSQYNRRKFSDSEGYVSCVTCGKRKNWKKLQAGHWLDGRNNSILFEDNGIHAQCLHCNYFGGGKTTNVKENYNKFMLKMYGKEEMDRLITLKPQAVKYTIEDYINIADEYSDKLVGLDMKEGL